MSKKRFLRACTTVLFLVIAAVLGPLTSAGAAQDTIYEVISLDDDGQGSLRQAIIAANSNPGKDTITFAVSGTIVLKSMLPTIGDDLRIDGSGQEVIISGNSQYRVMQIIAGDSTPVVEIDRVQIINGAGGQGAGILVDGAELILTNSAVRFGSAGAKGGAIYNQGGAVEVSGSTFFENAAVDGGAIYSTSGTVTVENSTFTINSAGGMGGAIYVASGTLNVSNSTFNRNGSAAEGSAIFNAAAATAVNNSTFSGNRILNPSASGTIANTSSATVTSSTFSANEKYNLANAGGGAMTVRNTILDDKDDKNCTGTIINGGNNIDSGTTCAWAANDGSLSSTDPKLGTLADNGGPTESIALQPGSPAVDAVLFNAPNECPDADQRGIPRPQGAACDIGAYEATRQSGPNFVVNVLEDDLADTDDGSCDDLVPGLTDCTLREAIRAANSDPDKNTITFALSGEITLKETLPTIGGDLQIDGSGRQITISGDEKYRVMNVIAADSLELELKQLTVSKGMSDQGGGIFNDGAEIVVTNGRFQGNMAGQKGGAIYNQSGAVSLTDTLFASNTAGSSAENDGGGALFTSGGALTILRSTFFKNVSAANGGAIYKASGTAAVTNSTFTMNETDGAGTLFNETGKTTVTNSTFAGDAAQDGALANDQGTLTLQNTIAAALDAKNCAGTITNGGNNIDSGTSCAWGANDGSMSGSDPKLDPLADNGGATETMALQADSPAIDAVLFNAPNECPAADQRGVTRPQGAACDIGAYELGMDPPPDGFAIYLPAVLGE